MPRAALKLKIDSTGRIQPSLDAVLSKALAPAALALLRAIIAEADAQAGPVYLVGGFVRDLLLGRPNLDLDLVFEGDAIRLGRQVAKRYGGDLQAHSPFGTAVWKLPEDKKPLLRQLGFGLKSAKPDQLPAFIDFISARGETYTRSAALPTVQFADLHTDQYRRDFTINTLALSLNGLRTGQLIDSWRGLPDLKAGLLRTLHKRSFSDDPTRIFRILRFAGRLGFRVEAGTLKQLKAALPAIKLLSGERIYNELEKILLEDKRVLILQTAQRLGVLRSIHSGLQFSSKAAALLVGAKPAPDYWELSSASTTDLAFVLWLMQLPPKQAAAVAERLRFASELRAAVTAAARLRTELVKLPKRATSAAVARLDKEPLLALYALFLANKGTAVGKLLQIYAQTLRHVQPRTDGLAIQKLGLKPGPAYRSILETLRAAWLDGEVKTAQQEQALLKKLIHEHR